MQYVRRIQPLRPRSPAPLHCAQCLAQLPAEPVSVMEMEDYVQYFCGLDCLAAWRARGA